MFEVTLLANRELRFKPRSSAETKYLSTLHHFAVLLLLGQLNGIKCGKHPILSGSPMSLSFLIVRPEHRADSALIVHSFTCSPSDDLFHPFLPLAPWSVWKYSIWSPCPHRASHQEGAMKRPTEIDSFYCGCAGYYEGRGWGWTDTDLKVQNLVQLGLAPPLEGLCPCLALGNRALPGVAKQGSQHTPQSPLCSEQHRHTVLISGQRPFAILDKCLTGPGSVLSPGEERKARSMRARFHPEENQRDFSSWLEVP